MLLSLPLFFSITLSVLLLAATVFDVTRLRIPNSIPALVIGLFALKVILGVETGPWMLHVPIAIAALALGFLAFAVQMLGGGDAKLIAALALWYGPELVVSFVTITGIAGGVLAVSLVLVRKSVLAAAIAPDVDPSPPRHPLLDPMAPVPYALPITLAALWLEWL